MNKPLQPLQQDLQVLCDTWCGALPPFGAAADTDATQVELESMSDAGLVRTTDAIARLTRDTEALLARVAGEIAAAPPPSSARTAWPNSRASSTPPGLSPAPPAAP